MQGHGVPQLLQLIRLCFDQRLACWGQILAAFGVDAGPGVHEQTGFVGQEADRGAGIRAKF